MKIRETYNNLLAKFKLEALGDVILFAIITIIIHYGWRAWDHSLHYWPITGAILGLIDWLKLIVYDQSFWVIHNLFGVEVTSINNYMYFANEGAIVVTGGCSGLKQIMQFVILMILFRGSALKKLWFIPIGAIVVHIVNIIRVSGLGLLMNAGISMPTWTFSHDYIFRPFFYVVIFLMWVLWVERISPPKNKQEEEVECKSGDCCCGK